MALIECRECKKPVSDSAGSCPACGFPMRRVSTSTRKTILVVAMLLGAFGAIVGFTVGNPFFGAVGAAGVVVGAVKLAMISS